LKEYDAARHFRLTPLEIDVLRGLSQGLQTKELATRLRRSSPTIESYVRLLCARFNARTRAHLVARAYACGLLNIEEAGFDEIASAS